MKKGVISILSILTGAVAGAGTVGKMAGKAVSQSKSMSDKYLSLFLMMNEWVRVKQEGKVLSSYFMRHGYKRIAIYGMSHVGETLIEELRNTEVQVAYGIDRNADRMHSEIDIFTLEDSLDKVDTIVVTAISYFNEIEEQLQNKVECPIISLEDILYEV